MPHCHEMRQGDIFVCKECGLELQVTKECRDVGQPADDCCSDSDTCTFTCCGEEMVKKTA